MGCFFLLLVRWFLKGHKKLGFCILLLKWTKFNSAECISEIFFMVSTITKTQHSPRKKENGWGEMLNHIFLNFGVQNTSLVRIVLSLSFMTSGKLKTEILEINSLSLNFLCYFRCLHGQISIININ